MDVETSWLRIEKKKKKKVGDSGRLLEEEEEEEEGGRVIWKGEGLARNSPRLQMLDRDRKRE